MMGQHDRSGALFYYFRLEDQVPETHLLRLIEKHISFAFVREKLKDSYSETGRPSIDPELLLRILLIGYLYGITSERKLVEELRMRRAWRWFTGLGFDQEIPHHSTFSKNRHGRFQGSKVFEQLFEQIVRQCVEVGLVQGKHLSVDGSFVEANAAKQSRLGINPRQPRQRPRIQPIIFPSALSAQAHIAGMRHDHFVSQFAQRPAYPRRMHPGLQRDPAVRHPPKNFLDSLRSRAQSLFL